jgi:hypothetical protein
MANLSKGVGGVWACQSQFCIAARDGKKGGDTLEFLATMEGCSLRETAETMHTWFGAIAVQTPPPTDERTEKPQLASKESSEPGTGVNKPLNFALRDIDPRHPYLVSRGVTEEPIRSTRPLILTPQLPVTRWHAVLALRAFREHDCHFGSFTSAPLFRRLAVPHEADDQQ